MGDEWPGDRVWVVAVGGGEPVLRTVSAGPCSKMEWDWMVWGLSLLLLPPRLSLCFSSRFLLSFLGASSVSWRSLRPDARQTVSEVLLGQNGLLLLHLFSKLFYIASHLHIFTFPHRFDVRLEDLLPRKETSWKVVAFFCVCAAEMTKLSSCHFIASPLLYTVYCLLYIVLSV